MTLMSQIGSDRAGSHVSTPDLLVLQALRVKGFVQAVEVASATGLDIGDIDALLSSLADAAQPATARVGCRAGC